MLDELGMSRLKISCDPFHQEYVDIELVRRLAKTAKEVLGDTRVLVRWEKYLDNPVEMKNIISRGNENKLYVEALKDYPCRFTGRAAGRIAELAASKTVEQIARSKLFRMRFSIPKACILTRMAISSAGHAAG